MNKPAKTLLLLILSFLVVVLLLAIADWIKISKSGTATVEVKVVVEK